jgi:DNA-binding response OmpR family regulator
MKSILLVEDDPEISKLLNLHFSSQAYNLIAAANGKDAMEEVLKNSFNLIILDITLPDTNGMELCKVFRKNRTVKR